MRRLLNDVETYSYDHFGRLAEKSEDGVATSYAYDAWGQRTKRTTKDAEGKVISEEMRAYDRLGRLAEIRSDGRSVRYAYGRSGRIEKQTVDGRTIAYGYTRYGRLAWKTLLRAGGQVAELKYWYGKDGKISARPSSWYAPGTIVRYHDHYEGNDAYMTPVVYEAMRAHEYGHAEAFFFTWENVFLPEVQKLNLTDSQDYNFILYSLYTVFVNAFGVDSDYQIMSMAAASDNTLSYFNNNPYWIAMEFDYEKLEYRWRKIE